MVGQGAVINLSASLERAKSAIKNRCNGPTDGLTVSYRVANMRLKNKKKACQKWQYKDVTRLILANQLSRNDIHRALELKIRKNFAYLRQGYHKEAFMILSRYLVQFFWWEALSSLFQWRSRFWNRRWRCWIRNRRRCSWIRNRRRCGWIRNRRGSWPTIQHLPEEKEEEDVNTKNFRQTKLEISLIQSCVNKYQ